MTFMQSLRALGDRRYPVILLFGFCSGLPWVLHGSVLTLWLQQSGVSRTMIGYFAIIGLVYAFNWLLGPLIDQLRLPLLGKLFGRYRAWILACQGGIALLLLLMSLGDPATDLEYIALVALGVAALSAVQDIAIDAYRIMIIGKDEMGRKMPYAAAMSIGGWWAGYGFVGGSIALALGGETVGMAWPQVYSVLALGYVAIIALIMFVPWREPEGDMQAAPSTGQLSQLSSKGLDDYVDLLRRRVVKPFWDLFSRMGPQLVIAVLLFLFVFRMGESMLGRMSLVFYREWGLSTDEIALYQKFFGGVMTAVFSILAAMVNMRFGLIRGLFIAGVAMAAANLLFAMLALIQPNIGLFMLTLAVDNFFQAFANVAVVFFISSIASRVYSGTQYALMSSVSTFGRTVLAGYSGVVVDYLDAQPTVSLLGANGEWVAFFVLTTLMVIPGLCLLLWVRRLLPSAH